MLEALHALVAANLSYQTVAAVPSAIGYLEGMAGMTVFRPFLNPLLSYGSDHEENAKNRKPPTARNRKPTLTANGHRRITMTLTTAITVTTAIAEGTSARKSREFDSLLREDRCVQCAIHSRCRGSAT